MLIKAERSHHSCSEHIEAGVAVDAFTTAQHAIITAVYSTDPNHTVHFLSKLPPLWGASHISQITYGSFNNPNRCEEEVTKRRRKQSYVPWGQDRDSASSVGNKNSQTRPRQNWQLHLWKKTKLVSQHSTFGKKNRLGLHWIQDQLKRHDWWV